MIIYGNVEFAQSLKNNCCLQNLIAINDIPYIPELSGDSLFWTEVSRGLDIVPCLINNLSNPTMTDISIPNWGGKYCIGDVAFSILCHIIHNIPIIDFISQDTLYPLIEEKCYFSYINYNQKNRKLLQTQIQKWYITNNKKFIWIVDENEYKVAKNWPFELPKNPARGYYVLP